MPKTTPVDGAAAAKPAKRFELPSLNFNFGSLTDGTDIPPPQPSPVLEVPTPPKTPVEENGPKKESNGTVNGHANGAGTSPQSDITSTTVGGLKRPIEEGPVSPTYSSRGSLRKYLSKNLLNTTYEEHGAVPGQEVSRPPSRTASTIASERKSKRGSGWFRRLRSNDSKRDSVVQFEEVKKEPPPPMIPELSAWESKVDTNLSDDFLKEIR
ncbi:uncharacterized protein JN550_003225 [Neoarthrinium moseri]|uniref:uncharacterized protein n=1 Tax=Neoarthrinium moseri TaxID=1658444 RepID=UPI001FDD3678|nr:uncharacterized protein JN550_003225 [Neoarthrinium moseri]KAI1873956.1 hypothetical protein JN550_003225 [Neoarthrinium moseri]